jgi:hypothetical protein
MTEEDFSRLEDQEIAEAETVLRQEQLYSRDAQIRAMFRRVRWLIAMVKANRRR